MPSTKRNADGEPIDKHLSNTYSFMLEYEKENDCIKDLLHLLVRLGEDRGLFCRLWNPANTQVDELEWHYLELHNRLNMLSAKKQNPYAFLCKVLRQNELPKHPSDDDKEKRTGTLTYWSQKFIAMVHGPQNVYRMKKTCWAKSGVILNGCVTLGLKADKRIAARTPVDHLKFDPPTHSYKPSSIYRSLKWAIPTKGKSFVMIYDKIRQKKKPQVTNSFPDNLWIGCQHEAEYECIKNFWMLLRYERELNYLFATQNTINNPAKFNTEDLYGDTEEILPSLPHEVIGLIFNHIMAAPFTNKLVNEQNPLIQDIPRFGGHQSHY